MLQDPTIQALVKVVIFSAFIHSINNVLKGISAKGVWGTVKELANAIIKQQPLSGDTLRTMSFALALVYCYFFDFDVMTDLLKVTIPDTDLVAWWLAYVGTASVVYEGVDQFYKRFKKMNSKLLSDNPSGPIGPSVAGK